MQLGFVAAIIYNFGKNVKNGVFWDDMPCGSFKNRRFGGT
jgi:hypothetical protein